jgi:zinc protease
VEHAVFLGTKKYPTADIIRTVLAKWGLSFGPDANAFTDFPQTVYTFHAPVSQESSQQKKDLLQVVDVLYELAFEALLLPEPVNVERGAVLSELKNCNTADYRMEYQRFQQVHANNVLSSRFPIGKEEQLKKFTADDLRKFYTKHYRVDNMSLHIVGKSNWIILAILLQHCSPLISIIM